MINFFKNIFIWWNQQTIGTMIHTIFFGKIKGKDEFGNKYYESKSGKRWVIYKNEVEATYIPPNWYSWIHFTNNELNDPSIIEKKYSWEKKHQPNLSGTKKAYRPKKIIENKKIPKKYETWKN